MSVAGVHKLWNFFLTALRAVRAAACERAANLIPDVEKYSVIITQIQL